MCGDQDCSKRSAKQWLNNALSSNHPLALMCRTRVTLYQCNLVIRGVNDGPCMPFM
jgi:hypothetical protein